MGAALERGSDLAATKSLWSSLPALAERLGRGETLAIGSDFDGTLAAIVAHSDDAVLPPRARAALRALAEAPSVRLGFFSGRTVADLAPRIGIEPAWYAGVCGLEVRDEAGVRRDPPVEGGGVPAALVDDLRAWCEGHPGTWVQDKGPAFAVHYRQLPARLQAAFTAGVRRRLHDHRDHVHALPGKKVFEISPRVAVDKGTALAQWLESAGGGPVCAVFMGDDVNDEPGYPEVRARGGIGVVVARRSTSAEFRVKSPTEAVWFLEWLAREWQWVRAGSRAGGGR